MSARRLTRRHALRLIAARSCEKLTSGPGSCLGWYDPIARDGADVACDPCIAWAALKRKRWPRFGLYATKGRNE